MTELNNWLNQINAVSLAEVRGPNNSRLFFYCANGITFIIQTFAEGSGWEIYIPPTTDGKIKETLEAAEYTLGLLAKE